MEHDPLQLHEALAALAAPRRFELLVLMLSGVDRSVSQLADAVGLSQSCTTRHLQALARAGFVKGVRDGKRVVFRIAPRDAAARAVLAWVSGGRGAQPAPHAGKRPAARRARPGAEPGRQRPERTHSRRRRASSRAAAIPRKVLAAAIRIESAAELEPYVADGAVGGTGPVGDAQPPPESGRTSEPEALPAWRRSDLEDFLL